MFVDIQTAIPEPPPPQAPAATPVPVNPLIGAAEVHRALCIPPALQIGRWQVASRIVPQRGIAGDFIVRLDRPGGTLVAIGDLMGKGLSAAMWLTHVIDLLHRATEPFDSVAGVLTRLNAELHNSRVGAPLTSLSLMHMEHDSARLRVASAGHPPAVLLGAGASIRLLDEGGPLLGALPTAAYQAAELELRPGDSLVAFSDGLVESRCGLGPDFGVEGVIRCLRGRRRQSAQTIAEGLLHCARRFAGPAPCDDISLLVLQRS